MNEILTFVLRAFGFHVHDFGRWKYYEHSGRRWIGRIPPVLDTEFVDFVEVRRFRECLDCGYRDDTHVRDGSLPTEWSEKVPSFDQDELE